MQRWPFSCTAQVFRRQDVLPKEETTEDNTQQRKTKVMVRVGCNRMTKQELSSDKQ